MTSVMSGIENLIFGEMFRFALSGLDLFFGHVSQGVALGCRIMRLWRYPAARYWRFPDVRFRFHRSLSNSQSAIHNQQLP